MQYTTTLDIRKLSIYWWAGVQGEVISTLGAKSGETGVGHPSRPVSPSGHRRHTTMYAVKRQLSAYGTQETGQAGLEGRVGRIHESASCHSTAGTEYGVLALPLW